MTLPRSCSGRHRVVRTMAFEITVPRPKRSAKLPRA